MVYDVIIIGSGVCGTSTAYELGKYDLRVLVLEKGFDLCMGGTRSNSGMLHAGFDPRPGSNMAKFNVAGNEMMDQLCETLDIPIYRCPTIIFATDEEQTLEVERLKANADLNGVEARVVRAPEIFELQPYLSKTVVAALYVPKSGMIPPYELVHAMAENASVNGVEFQMNTEVEGFVQKDDGWIVKTNKGDMEAKVVVNCAGTHSAELNNMVSVRKYEMIPRLGMNLVLDRSVNNGVNAIINETPHDLPGGGHTKGVAVMPSVEGTLILGCSAEMLGDLDKVDSTKFSIDYIVNYFENMWNFFPVGRGGEPFPKNKIIAYYAGIRAHCTEDDFVIGEAPDAPRFLNAVGIESPGLTAGPAIGKHLGELCVNLLDATCKPDDTYHAGRKLLKAFRTMTNEERNQAILDNPEYAKVVCRCEQVTEAEIRDSIRRPCGATSIDGVKMRTRAGMGRCQGSFCSPRVLEILAEELGITPLEVLQRGPGSNVLCERACQQVQGGDLT